MIIISKDQKRSVNVGTSDILHAVYSTICICLEKNKDYICQAISFLENKKCPANDAIQTARQFNLVRDMLSSFKPEDAVYDMNDVSKTGPWAGSLSEVVTSCANLFTTEDGKDLLFEIVSILCYGGYCKSDIIIQ